eukprot:254054-Alexandrium_andersonii.AAC.1
MRLRLGSTAARSTAIRTRKCRSCSSEALRYCPLTSETPNVLETSSPDSGALQPHSEALHRGFG